MEPESSDEDNYEAPPKKMKTEWVKSYSNKAMEMMKKMGYEDDKGLGKLSQGRLEPIVAVQQGGRRGLGLVIDAVQTSAEHWDPNSEEIKLPEDVFWISSDNLHIQFDIEEMREWIKYGPRKDTIDDETLFCEPVILKQILESKTVFDKLNENDLRRARSRCNPFETIRNSIFLNRAAVKMANIDSMCDFMFTDPRDEQGNPLVNQNELLYFADICAGPGGFTEYVLYKKSWEAKGFGLTLKDSNDFKLDKFFAASPESFDPYYGVNDDGDIFDKDNQDSFAQYVLKHTPQGVHFVMADGGFSVDGKENIQEVLSKQLYLCQFLTALKILREKGNFVCKLFDVFTPFSVGLVYLMYQSFEKIAIIKPNSSRPANSERYLVCKGKRPNTEAVRDYFDDINNILNDNKDEEMDVLEIVGLDIMRKDDDFINYIIDSNNSIGRNQVVGLRKIAAFCHNPQLKETRQTEIRKKCLDLWKLPDKLRKPPEAKTTESFLEEILGNWYADRKWLHSSPIELNSISALKRQVESVFDWHFVPIGRSETSLNICSMFLCKTKGTLLRFTESRKWEPVENKFDISTNTLFYGEIALESSGEGRTQTRVNALHIIDAVLLGGRDVRRLSLTARRAMCEKYALSVNKPYKPDTNIIRCKRLFRLTELNSFFNEMRPYILKDNSKRLGCALSLDKYFVPGGILLFCEILHNYFSKMSKSRNMLYYFDKTSGQSYYKDSMPPEIQAILFASFRNSYQRRLIWKWTNIKQVDIEPSGSLGGEDRVLYRYDLQSHILSQEVT